MVQSSRVKAALGTDEQSANEKAIESPTRRARNQAWHCHLNDPAQNHNHANIALATGLRVQGDERLWLKSRDDSSRNAARLQTPPALAELLMSAWRLMAPQDDKPLATVVSLMLPQLAIEICGKRAVRHTLQHDG